MPQATALHLRWLFVAFFKDGSTIEQDQMDRPKEQPEGSAFSDVLARMDELTAFELHHEEGSQIVTVDLQTGAFIVNGTPIHIHEQNFDPTNYPLKLVFFRETRAEQNIISTVESDLSISQDLDGPTRHYINRYFIGWETEVAGQHKQVTLAVG